MPMGDGFILSRTASSESSSDDVGDSNDPSDSHWLRIVDDVVSDGLCAMAVNWCLSRITRGSDDAFDSVGAVWARSSGLGPRGRILEPRTLEALLEGVGGKREKAGDFARAGDVARRCGLR
jgi:hypothetical protein